MTAPATVTVPARLSELLRIFASAGDLGRGQGDGHVAQVCWIGMRLAEALKLSPETRVDVYFTTLLVHGGCTAGTAEFAAFIASDELAAQRDFCLCNPENLVEALACMKRNVAPGASLPKRLQTIMRVMVRGDETMEGVKSGCADVGSRIATRLGLPDGAAKALGCICETWQGRGPRRLEGSAIPVAARIAHAAMVAAVFYRESGRDAALAALERRGGKSVDPEVARAFGSLASDEAFWEGLASDSVAEAALALEPKRAGNGAGPGPDDIALACADFVDLKSPRTAAHSRATAELAERMARALGLGDAEIALCRRAALVHDLGQVGVSSWVLERPAVTPAQRAQLELHPQLTEQLLSSVPALREIAVVAGAHHERLDGSGYPHGLWGSAIPLASRVLAVADEHDEWVRGTQGRAAMTSGEALRAIESDAGVKFDRDCVRALGEALAAVAPARAPRGTWPAGLTDREVEVLRLVALGLTLKEIARDLSVSVHTARHHLEHVYEKLGVSSRAGATLFAVENGLVS